MLQNTNRQLLYKNLAAFLSKRQWPRRMLSPQDLIIYNLFNDKVLGCWMIYFYSCRLTGLFDLWILSRAVTEKKDMETWIKATYIAEDVTLDKIFWR